MKTIKNIFIIFLLIIINLLILINSQKINVLSKNSDETFVKTIDEFHEALSRQKTNIVLTSIDFKGATYNINYSVNIKGSDNTELSNVYFVIQGPNVINEQINVSFKELTLNGGFIVDQEILMQEKAFDEIFESSRDNKRCININEGYSNLILDSCIIMHYASEVGPAIYLENVYNKATRNVVIKNSIIMGNIAGIDTIHLSNDLLNFDIDNSKFFNNYAYKGAGMSLSNGKGSINNCDIYDNYFVKYDYSLDNDQLCGGGLFIGGTKSTIKNTNIINNESNYGGGLGVASQKFGENQMLFENVKIKANKAFYGGAICSHSLVGQPITFINCDISGNSSKIGSIIYSLVYGYFNRKTINNGGLIEFLFTSFVKNEAEDQNTFEFYKVDQTAGKLGIISLKGCLIIGNDKYSKEDLNYQTDLDTAIQKGIINVSDVENIKSTTIKINKDSEANILVNKKTYNEWSEHLKDYNGVLTIGYNENPFGAKNNRLLIALALFIGVIVIAIVIISIMVVRNHNIKKGGQDLVEDENGELIRLLNTLTEREKQVMILTINGKKRKEIAEELFYSENTIKKDLSIIYNKLGVNDKTQLIIKYKNLI